MSLNCHGSFNLESFQLPEDVYVLAPHPEGFDKPYILLSPSKGSFEDRLYASGDGKFPTPDSGGWRLYKPGENVPNLQLSSWSGGTASEEYRKWSTSSGEKDKDLFDSKNIPAFATVPARAENGDQYQAAGEMKKKVKVFGNTNLREVIRKLRQENKEKPIVLIPFVCNAAANQNARVKCDGTSLMDMQALFSEKPIV